MKSVRKLSMMSNFAIVFIGLALLMVSCSKGNLEISQPTVDKEKVEIGKTASLSVDVKNPGGLKLEYKWKAEKGTIAPSQLSPTIAAYTAADMPGEDTVILEVSSKGKTVFTSQAVKIEVVSEVISKQPPPGVPSITITKVPQKGGGPVKRDEIAGKVSGVDRFDNYRVVIYSLTDQFYVQPYDTAPHTQINSDGTWSAFIHLGIQYVALLVEESYQPPAHVTNPPAGTKILARTTATPK